MQYRPIVSALCLAAALGASADEMPLATTQQACAFTFDSLTPQPFRVASLSPATALPYLSLQTVKATAPDGTVTTLASTGGAAGTVDWTPSAGGVWVLENSVEGRVLFSARHGLFGTQGTGTASNPLKVVDRDELADLIQAGTAEEGSVFETDPLLSSATVVLPDGWAVRREAQKWILAEPADGILFSGTDAAFCFDSRQPGPDRKVRAKGALPIAYSGDGWGGAAAAASQLTFTPPSGEALELQFKGTGAYPFRFSQDGLWLVSLSANGKTDDAYVYILSEGFYLILR